jgi:hypothetical protein
MKTMSPPHELEARSAPIGLSQAWNRALLLSSSVPVTFHHDMVLAERIPNRLLVDIRERLERLHDRRANALPPV